MRRVVRLELCPRERPPQSGNRHHSGGISGDDVVRGVAHEHRFFRAITQFFQRQPHRKRIRLVDVARIVADGDFDVLVGVDVLEPAVHHRVALARHHSHRMTTLIEQHEGLDHAFVGCHQPIVVLVLEGAVPVYQPLAILVRFDVRRQLLGEGSSEALDPLSFGRTAGPALESVVHARQEQRDRIDQRSVEIEQHCQRSGLCHDGKVNPLYAAL